MNTNGSNPLSFPPLSSNSPNVAEEQVTESGSSISRRATISVVGEISQETQRHLQHTSAALDAAYNRIRQVRRSLLDLSESLPVSMPQPRSEEPESPPEPGHDADINSLPPDSQISAGESGEGLDARVRAPWNRAQSSSQPTPYTSFSGRRSNPMDVQQPMNSNPAVPWDAFSNIRTSLANRDVQGDDGSTLLGRRVAARIAVGPTISDAASATNQLMQGVGQIHDGTFNSIGSVTRSYEEDLEHILRYMGERRRGSIAVSSRPTRNRSSIRPSSRGLPQRSLQQSSQGTSPSPSQASPTLSSLNTQLELDPGRVSNNRQHTGSSEQLSLSSNLSVQNFSAAISDTPSRPLIFDEPLNYVSPEMVDPLFQSRYNSVPDFVPQGRNYVVHRRFDRNGEELVHNIILDWGDSDSVSLSMPSANVPRRHINHLSSPRQSLDLLGDYDPLAPAPLPLPLPEDDGRSSNSTEGTPRRRGWARLDLDGNEIPSDEEEELERVRTEHRILAMQRTQAFSPFTQSAGRPNPATSPPPPPELTIYRNFKPPVVLRHDPSLSYPEGFVNPLPMPLSEMVVPGKNAKRKPTLLPRHAIVAGR